VAKLSNAKFLDNLGSWQPKKEKGKKEPKLQVGPLNAELSNKQRSVKQFCNKTKCINSKIIIQLLESERQKFIQNRTLKMHVRQCGIA
jgi:hypothetical protein